MVNNEVTHAIRAGKSKSPWNGFLGRIVQYEPPLDVQTAQSLLERESSWYAHYRKTHPPTSGR